MTEFSDSFEETNLPPDPRLIEMLVCPLTKGPLEYNENTYELVSRLAHLAFPVRNGIPVMLEDQARAI